jgi:hypothetical protein
MGAGNQVKHDLDRVIIVLGTSIKIFGNFYYNNFAFATKNSKNHVL